MATSGLRAQSVQATLDVDVDKPGVAIPPTFYGLMTEEINHAYDGGLYAELIQNRTFQDNSNSPVHWKADGAKLALDRANPVNPANPVCLRVDLNGDSASVANGGFWGIPVKPNTTYAVSFYAKGNDNFGGKVAVSINGDDGTAYANSDAVAVGPEWKKYTFTLRTKTDIRPTQAAKFALNITGGGSVSFNLVSLFPPTYQNTPGGLRVDLMELMHAMRPAFIRLPGGNYLEGDTFETRFDWKKQIGPVDQRPGHVGCWGYRSSDGMGLTQMLLWCRQLNAEPVLGVFAGYVLRGQHVDAGPELQQYVDEAIEEIEYVTGGPDTKWGKQRIADGLTEPFKLTYVEIGNEDWFDRSGSYDGRFKQFYDAIKAKYPHLKVIASMPVTSRTPDLYDDHSYRKANQMVIDSTGFDAPKDPNAERDVHYNGGRHYGLFGRKGPQLFYGEWASQEGRPTPNLKSGLGDAVFAMGLERNADLIPMQCYAPLLVNVNPGASQWGTNLIGYDAMTAFGSPSYHVLAMFGQNRGDVVLPVAIATAQRSASAKIPVATGGVGVGTWLTDVEYKNVSVTSPDGKPMLAKANAAKWENVGDEWTIGDSIKPADPSRSSWSFVGDRKWTDYTVRVKARKNGGPEGFLLLWHATDADTYTWWNIGGWGNTRTQLEQGRDGGRTPYGPESNFAVEAGVWYDLRVDVRGNEASCYINDKLIYKVKDPPDEPPVKAVHASASYINASHELVLKVVNYGANQIDATVNLRGVGTVGTNGKAIVMSGDLKAVNTIAEPTKVAPKEEPLTNAAPTFRRTFPPYSVTLIRVPASRK